jgi:hypothetical protein
MLLPDWARVLNLFQLWQPVEEFNGLFAVVRPRPFGRATTYLGHYDLIEPLKRRLPPGQSLNSPVKRKTLVMLFMATAVPIHTATRSMSRACMFLGNGHI